MKTWLINTYGGPSRIVGDIISNLSGKSKPVGGNRKDKFIFYSAITGAIQRLERLSRANYINKTELEACLLSLSILSSLVLLLLVSEHNIWVREMTVAGLDFRNPVGLETFNCFTCSFKVLGWLTLNRYPLSESIHRFPSILVSARCTRRKLQCCCGLSPQKYGFERYTAPLRYLTTGC